MVKVPPWISAPLAQPSPSMPTHCATDGVSEFVWPVRSESLGTTHRPETDWNVPVVVWATEPHQLEDTAAVLLLALALAFCMRWFSRLPNSPMIISELTYGTSTPLS